MSREAQAPFRLVPRHLAPFACLCAALVAGCAGGGIPDPGIDTSITTTSVGADDPALPKDAIDRSDATILAGAVGVADMRQLRDIPLSWANAETGSDGTVDTVTEYVEEGRACRRFSGARQSFRGIGRVSGSLCLGDDGAWRPRAFSAR